MASDSILVRARRLLLVFGLWGLVVWPATGWLGGVLLYDEIAGMNGLHTSPSTLLGRDFVNLWHGGQEAAAHGAGAIYDRDAYRETLMAKAGVYGIYAYSYPPHMLLLSMALAPFSYLMAYALWTILGLALFVQVARPFLRDARLPVWAALLLPGGIVNLWAGHFGFLIGALSLYGWRWAGRSPPRAGLAFALMTVKPHMGVLVPLVLALRRDWRTMVWAGLGVVLLVIASLLAFGSGAWSTWLGSTLGFQAGLIELTGPRVPEYIYMMPTVGRMAHALGLDGGAALAVQLAFALSGLALLAWAAMRRASLADLGLLSLAATPLLLPYVFNYDLVALSLAALLWAARSPARWWSPERLAYAAAFVAPLVQAPLAREGYWMSPLALLAALAFAAWRSGQADIEAPA